MARSRSRSPRRDRRRSRSRSRDRERHRRRRSRSRSRDRRRRSRSRDRPRHNRDDRRQDRDRDRGGRQREEETEVVFQPVVKPQVTDEELQAMPQDEQDLMKVMGFSGFDSTKDKQVVGNDLYCANISKKRRYRQYMNRKGGFNRPLDFIA